MSLFQILLGNEIEIAAAPTFEFRGISGETYFSEIAVATPPLAWFSFIRSFTKVLKCFSLG